MKKPAVLADLQTKFMKVILSFSKKYSRYMEEINFLLACINRAVARYSVKKKENAYIFLELEKINILITFR